MKKAGLLVLTMIIFVGCSYVSLNDPFREDKAIASVIADPSTDINGTHVIHYVIKFDANLGNGDMPDVSADGGQSVVLPVCTFSAPTGKKFGFWNKNSDGTDGISYADCAAVKDLAEIDGETVTLYAQWIDADSHKITYLNTKNVNNPNVLSFKESENVVLQNLSLTGYTFDGWYNVKIYEVVNGWSAGDRTTDVSLGAKWTPNTYTIIFNSNGGSGNMNSQNMTYDSKAALSANSFTKSSSTFLGWSENPVDTVARYSDGSKVVNLTETNGGEVTLYAVWQPDMTDYDSYTVIFKANGGSGTMDNQAIKYNAAARLNPNLFTRTAYTFQGWAVSESGAKVYDDKQSVTNLGLADTTVDLYAVWQPISYTITFSRNGGTGTMSSLNMTYGETKSLTANGFSREHYTFKEWNTAADGKGTSYSAGQSVSNLATDIGANVTLYAIWQGEWYIGDAGNFCYGDTVYIKTGMRQVLSDSTTITCDQSTGIFRTVRGSVTLDKYAIGKYPVTQEFYAAVMGNNPSTYKTTPLGQGETNGLLRPIDNVSWYDAIIFCNKLSLLFDKTRCYKLKDGTYPDEQNTVPTSSDTNSENWYDMHCDWAADGYRLPTQCEWECAARGGTYSTGTPWTYKHAGSNNIADVAWYQDNSEEHSWEVGLKQSNTLGLYDMNGNLWEWCWDYYNDWSVVNSSMPVTGLTTSSGYPNYHCLQGGAGGSPKSDLTDFNHIIGWATYCHANYTGFRLACKEAAE